MRVVPLAIVITVVGGLAGCSYGSPLPHPGPSTACVDSSSCERSLDADGMLAQWEEAAANLELPPGAIMVPPDLAELGGSDQEYDALYGESIAHSQWFCLWETEWLAQPDPSSSEATEAMSQLRSFFETRTFREDYGGDVGLVSMVDDAAAGESERLRRDVEVNCSSL